MSRILIVEDEVAIADLEKDYLELSGFEVEVENDGTSGLARALAEDFDLFILDLMLRIQTMYLPRRSSSRKSGIWIRSEILRQSLYISRRFVRKSR